MIIGYLVFGRLYCENEVNSILYVICKRFYSHSRASYISTLKLHQPGARHVKATYVPKYRV